VETQLNIYLDNKNIFSLPDRERQEDSR